MTLGKILLVAGAMVPGLVKAVTYQITKDYSGSTFFDDWIFYNNIDNLTNGNADYVSASTAAKSKLAFVNDAGNAIIKVDNASTVTFGNNRNTVRIGTKDSYTVGSLWIADMLHVPYGCSTWPAFWSSAAEWPSGGEIDTFEGVNLVTQNTMSLHTDPGCVQSGANQTSTLVNTTDCSFEANDNSGCGVIDPSTSSYGAAFASAGGGMFVTEFASTGISVWFFNRSSVPSSLQNNASSVDVSTLGIPTSNWPNSGCNIDQFFAAQTIVFDITLCGDYAGLNSVFEETCSGLCYDNWVVGPGSNFDNAYFEVASVRVFNNGSDTTVLGSGARPTTRAGVLLSAVVAFLSIAILSQSL